MTYIINKFIEKKLDTKENLSIELESLTYIKTEICKLNNISPHLMINNLFNLVELYSEKELSTYKDNELSIQTIFHVYVNSLNNIELIHYIIDYFYYEKYGFYKYLKKLLITYINDYFLLSEIISIEILKGNLSVLDYKNKIRNNSSFKTKLINLYENNLNTNKDYIYIKSNEEILKRFINFT